jgi:hypothetical protein
VSASGCVIEYDHLPQIAASLQPKAGAVVRATIHRIEARAKTSMSGAKHGLTYRRGAIKSRRKADKGQVIGYKFHRASSPGEAPAVDTGALMNSVKAEMVGTIEGVVYTNMQYAVVLEYGFGKMKGPRPFMRPAADAERQRHHDEMARALGAGG